MVVLDHTNFKILNASAGTGKTYRLTKDYLLSLLSNKGFQHSRNLLAITFTNKAVTEMKERILENLHAFCQDTVPAKNKGLFQEVAQELALPTKELQERAGNVLTRLLHNYAFFDISTIDRFNHRLIRTFARDLNVAQNFEVELDTDFIVDMAVNRVLDKAGTEKDLTNVLVNFTLEKIGESKSWNISYDLNKIGKLLYQENHFEHLKTLTSKKLQDFLALKTSLAQKSKMALEAMREASQTSLSLIVDNGLEFSDFNRASFPKFLEKIHTDPLHLSFKEKWKQNFGHEDLYPKKCAEDKKQLIDGLMPTFISLFESIQKNHNLFSFLKRCEKNIVPLGLIAEISREIEILKEERNFLAITELNRLIAKEIKKQPMPFIYERLGERYRNYFVDEFQDTSQLQWDNLIPLIGNALESEDLDGEKGSLLLVGDVKQAIYRWRGGEAEQFLNLVIDKENPFTVNPSIENLEKNWRSYDEIISFNNEFFSYCSKELSNPDYQNIYALGNQQETNTKKGGLVHISFMENDHGAAEHPHCEKVLSAINAITANGHTFGDICILVRSNKNGVLLADYLALNHIPLISQEALLLKNNAQVTFLVSFLYYLTSPEEMTYQFELLEYLSETETEKHDFYAKNLNNLPAFFLDSYGLAISSLQQLSLDNLFETLICTFDLVPDQNIYVNFFMDVVFEFEQRVGYNPSAFLGYWELKKDTLSISSPENSNAVRIMTIHKSKGLEFPFVIFPFADSVINDSRKRDDIWFPVKPDEFEGFDELMVTANPVMEHYSTASQSAYLQEEEKSELDDFNVLYVALTRAVYGLYIVTSPVRNTATKTYSGLLHHFLRHKEIYVEGQTDYTLGALAPNAFFKSSQIETKAIPYIYGNDLPFELVPDLRMEFDRDVETSIAFGNLLHKALAAIYSADDLEPALKQWQDDPQLLSISTKEKLKALIHEIVHHDQLCHFYRKDATIFNETEILKPDGSTIRPDRLVVAGNRASLIDYKTGKPSNSHHLQLQGYAAAIEAMGYIVENKYLVYIAEEKTTILSV